MADADEQDCEQLEPSPDDETESKQAPTTDRVVRTSLVVLAVLAVIVTLAVGKQVLMPVAAATLLSFACTPAQAALRRLGFSSGLAAAVLILSGLTITVGLTTLIAQPALEWAERAPTALRRLEAKAKGLQQSVKDVTEATEKATALAKGQSGERAQPVEIVGARPSDLVFGQTLAILLLGTATIVLLFFLLLDGEEFLYKVVGAIPAISGKMHVICLAQEVRKTVSYYLLTITTINSCLGVLTALGMWLLEMPSPILWGALAGIFNFAPFVGAVATAFIVTIVAAAEFSEPWQIAAPPLLTLTLTTIEGYFVTPLILGRRLELNPVAVFVSIIFWGWIWGIPGVLLATPLLATFKIASDRVPSLQGVGELLGR